MQVMTFLLLIMLVQPLSDATSDVLGDVNNDGHIGLNEAIYAIQVSAGIEQKIECSGIIKDETAYIKDETDLITTNRKPVGMESNILYNAENRYEVTYSGMELSGSDKDIGIHRLFDADLGPLYQKQYSTKENPFIVTISKIPAYHTQVGAWIGWTTRGLPPRKFKIEGYNSPPPHLSSSSTEGWVTLSDNTLSDNYDYSFYTKVKTSGCYSKLRFTFYGPHYNSGEYEGYIGISELVYILSESVRPYSGLLPTSMWEVHGRIGINTKNPTELLEVNGNIKMNGNLISNKGNVLSVSDSGDICIGKCH